MSAAPGTAAYNAKQARRYQKRAQQQANIAGTIGSLGILAQGLGSYARQRREQEYLAQMNGYMGDLSMGGPQAPAPAPPMALYDQPQGPMTGMGQPPVAMGEAAQIPMAPPQAQPQGNPFAGTLSEMAGMRVPPSQSRAHFGVMGQLRQDSQEFDRNRRRGEIARWIASQGDATQAVQEGIASGYVGPGMARDATQQAYFQDRNNAEDADRARAEQERAAEAKSMSSLAPALEMMRNHAAKGGHQGLDQAFGMALQANPQQQPTLSKFYEQVREGLEDHRARKALETGDLSGLTGDELNKLRQHQAAAQNVTGGASVKMPPEAKPLISSVSNAFTMDELEELRLQAQDMGPEAFEAVDAAATRRAGAIKDRRSRLDSLMTKRDQLLDKYRDVGSVRQDVDGNIIEIPPKDQERMRKEIARNIRSRDLHRAGVANPRLPTKWRSVYADLYAVLDGRKDWDDVDYILRNEDGTKEHAWIMDTAYENGPYMSPEEMVLGVLAALERLR